VNVDLDVPGCLACDLAHGRRVLPGGLITETGGWRVEHCVGPLGVGTLLVKPSRHVESVADLSRDEAVALGPLLSKTADVVTALCDPEQVYVCLWSHAGGRRGHIHFVAQPVTKQVMGQYGDIYGPALQLAMFDAGDVPDAAAVDDLAARARAYFFATS
jgi:diadenosine tetraphosphate (Ap4A) HIT family hydrolase